MDDIATDFNRGAIRPMECLRSGWALIKDNFWLFLGIDLVGVLIGSAAPFGVLLGPMMCGIYLCFFRTMRGQQPSFNRLFDGFQYFLPSFIATLFMMVPGIVVGVGSYIAMMILMFSIGFMQPQGQPPDGSTMALFFGVIFGMFLFIMVLSIALHALFFFAYPLIIDRQLTGPQAVMTSIRACFGNLGGLLGLLILTTLLSMVGLLACYVGAFFVLPISFAANACAYRQVFPDRRREEVDEETDDELPEDRPPQVEPAPPTAVVPGPPPEAPGSSAGQNRFGIESHEQDG
jgi:hypothetical protein